MQNQQLYYCVDGRLVLSDANPLTLSRVVNPTSDHGPPNSESDCFRHRAGDKRAMQPTTSDDSSQFLTCLEYPLMTLFSALLVWLYPRRSMVCAKNSVFDACRNFALMEAVDVTARHSTIRVRRASRKNTDNIFML